MDWNDPLQRWTALEACRDLVISAARAVDQQDPAAFAACFTPDGELTRPGGEPLRGRAAIEAAYAARDPVRLTRHLLSNHQLSVAPGAQIHSRCAVLLWTGRHTDAPTPRGRPADPLQQVGGFDDWLSWTPDGWRIARRVAAFELYLGVL